MKYQMKGFDLDNMNIKWCYSHPVVYSPLNPRVKANRCVNLCTSKDLRRKPQSYVEFRKYISLNCCYCVFEIKMISNGSALRARVYRININNIIWIRLESSSNIITTTNTYEVELYFTLHFKEIPQIIGCFKATFTNKIKCKSSATTVKFKPIRRF